MKDPTDITANRHGGNPESVAAHRRLKAKKKILRERVFLAIDDCGLIGLTCRELAEDWEVPMHRISGRFTELKADGRIRKPSPDAKRSGSGVYVATHYLD